LIYLLDTNAVSDLIHSYAGIEKWLSELSPDDRIVTCTIVRGEILFGIFKLPEGKRRVQLEIRARKFLDGIPCEGVPPSAADIYAELKSAQRRIGLPLDESDLWIAATVMNLGATLVSRDTDFRKIDGLSVIALPHQ
jgi:predicted nucleic acid-binding protein